MSYKHGRDKKSKHGESKKDMLIRTDRERKSRRWYGWKMSMSEWVH
jgi:hypothetical protein